MSDIQITGLMLAHYRLWEAFTCDQNIRESERYSQTHNAMRAFNSSIEENAMRAFNSSIEERSRAARLSKDARR